MSEVINQDGLRGDEFVRRAQKLCEQARLVESKWRELEIERDVLTKQADKLRDLALSLARFAVESQNSFDRHASELLRIVDDIEGVSQWMNKSQTANDDNVRPINKHLAPSPTENKSDATAAHLSLRLLCQQASYIVVYLNRAIEARDVACLPRLAEDLQRICSAMPSPRMKAASNEFMHACTKPNWSVIKTLQKALEDELSAISQTSDLLHEFEKVS